MVPFKEFRHILPGVEVGVALDGEREVSAVAPLLERLYPDAADVHQVLVRVDCLVRILHAPVNVPHLLPDGLEGIEHLFKRILVGIIDGLFLLHIIQGVTRF